MGIFDFVKSVGNKLGLTDDEPPAEEAVKKEMDSYDLGTEKVDVKVEGDKVVLTGEVDDESIFEKAVIAVGNTLGISKVETTGLKVANATAEPQPVFHTVEKGDTLWAIATKHYGNGAKYNAIFEANKPMLTHPDKIYPGQVLRIPQEGKA